VVAIMKGSTLGDRTDFERRHSPTPTGSESLLARRTTCGRRWRDIPPSPWGTFSPFFPFVRTLGHFRREGCALDQKFCSGLCRQALRRVRQREARLRHRRRRGARPLGHAHREPPPSNCVHVVTLLKMPPPQNYAPRVTIGLPKPPLSSSHSIYNIRQTGCRPAASFNRGC